MTLSVAVPVGFIKSRLSSTQPKLTRGNGNGFEGMETFGMADERPAVARFSLTSLPFATQMEPQFVIAEHCPCGVHCARGVH